MGMRRFRESAAPILVLGVIGTFGTAALVAAAAHYALGFPWIVSGSFGAALSPTDPAVTFSVLAGKEVSGRSGTILEGESGFNDPVGIALMIGMVELATHRRRLDADGRRRVRRRDGRRPRRRCPRRSRLIALIRRVPLPDSSLYPIAVLLAVGVIYGTASVAHGSGFLGRLRRRDPRRRRASSRRAALSVTSTRRSPTSASSRRSSLSG